MLLVCFFLPFPAVPWQAEATLYRSGGRIPLHSFRERANERPTCCLSWRPRIHEVAKRTPRLSPNLSTVCKEPRHTRHPGRHLGRSSLFKRLAEAHTPLPT